MISRKLLMIGLGVITSAMLTVSAQAQYDPYDPDDDDEADTTRTTTTTTTTDIDDDDDYDPYYDDSRVGIAVGPVGGYHKAQDADDGRWLVGAALRGKFAPFVGAELSINYRQEKYADDALTVRSWPVQVSGLLYPVPFLYGVIGGGWYNITFDYNETLEESGRDDETRNEFGWHAGGGIEVPIAPQVSLSGDVRWVFLDYNLDDFPPDDDDSEEFNSDFYMISGMLLFGF